MCLLPGLSAVYILQNSSPSISFIPLYPCYSDQEAESNIFSLKSWADISDFDQWNAVIVTDTLGLPGEGTRSLAASTWASWNACSGEASYHAGNPTTLRLPCCKEGQACHVERVHGDRKRCLGSSQLFQPCEWGRHKICEWKRHLGCPAQWNLQMTPQLPSEEKHMRETPTQGWD